MEKHKILREVFNNYLIIYFNEPVTEICENENLIYLQSGDTTSLKDLDLQDIKVYISEEIELTSDVRESFLPAYKQAEKFIKLGTFPKTFKTFKYDSSDMILNLEQLEELLDIYYLSRVYNEITFNLYKEIKLKDLGL